MYVRVVSLEVRARAGPGYKLTSARRAHVQLQRHARARHAPEFQASCRGRPAGLVFHLSSSARARPWSTDLSTATHKIIIKIIMLPFLSPFSLPRHASIRSSSMIRLALCACMHARARTNAQLAGRPGSPARRRRPAACQLTAMHRSIFSGDRPAAARAVGRPVAAQSAT